MGSLQQVFLCLDSPWLAVFIVYNSTGSSFAVLLSVQLECASPFFFSYSNTDLFHLVDTFQHNTEGSPPHLNPQPP